MTAIRKHSCVHELNVRELRQSMVSFSQTTLGVRGISRQEPRKPAKTACQKIPSDLHTTFVIIHHTTVLNIPSLTLWRPTSFGRLILHTHRQHTDPLRSFWSYGSAPSELGPQGSDTL